MDLRQQIELCSHYYQKWKNLALASNNLKDAKKFLKKACFWLELQSAYLALWSIEQLKGKDPRVKKKLMVAKANLAKKLADYAEEVLKELGF